jgi:hypothetical protein
MSSLNLFQALRGELVSANSSDTWATFRSASVSKVSKAYKLLKGNDGTCTAIHHLSGYGKAVVSRDTRSSSVFFWLLMHNRLNTRALLKFLWIISPALCAMVLL